MTRGPRLDPRHRLPDVAVELLAPQHFEEPARIGVPLEADLEPRLHELEQRHLGLRLVGGGPCLVLEERALADDLPGTESAHVKAMPAGGAIPALAAPNSALSRLPRSITVWPGSK